MLWHKAWLETRWRFVTGLVILTLSAGGTVYAYVEAQRLLPMLDTRSSAIDSSGPLGSAIKEAIELQRDFRGFIFFQTFRQNLTQMGVFFAVLLGCGGLLAESAKGSALFTLSLPVTRKQLLATRAATGLAQCFAIAMIPPLAVPLFAPVIGQQFSIVDALAHGLCLFFVGAVFFSLAAFFSTLFSDIWRPMLITYAIGCVFVVIQVMMPDAGLFKVMSGETYFRTGALPWAGLMTSAVLATAFLYSAAESLERRDF